MNLARHARMFPGRGPSAPLGNAPYLSFLNLPVLAGCVGAWALLWLVGAGVASLLG